MQQKIYAGHDTRVSVRRDELASQTTDFPFKLRALERSTVITSILKYGMMRINVMRVDAKCSFLKTTPTGQGQRLILCQKTNQEFLNFKSQVPSTG